MVSVFERLLVSEGWLPGGQEEQVDTSGGPVELCFPLGVLKVRRAGE